MIVTASKAQTTQKIVTHHKLYCADSRKLDFLKDNSIHLALTSPPYWTLKRYNENNAQLFPKDQKKTKDILSLAIKTKRITSPQDVIERIFIKKVLGYIQNQKKQVMPCVAFRASFSLDQFGNVMPCLMWGYKVRNVRDFSYSILSILNSEDAKRVRAMIKNKKCPNCWTPCEAYQSIISELLSFRIFPL